MPKQSERKAGYLAGLMTAGNWLKGRIVGGIVKGNIIVRGEVRQKEGHLLFVASKEELEELTGGKLPSHTESKEDK